MFDPFKDFETEGYLRNSGKDKDPRKIKHSEHDYFEAHIDDALEHLANREEVTYEDFLEVHRILFCQYYPWAGQDRLTTAPTIAVTKGSVLFARPDQIRLAVQHGLWMAQDTKAMAEKPGEVMGLFAFGHPFLDGNGRTMLLVHMELCHRAGFSLEWQKTSKEDYLTALTREIDTPSKGILDAYLLQFKGPKIPREAWGSNIIEMKGLDGLDEDNHTGGDLSDPAVAERYRQIEEKRGYVYTAAESLADKWSAVPGKSQRSGCVVALSDSEVIQDVGRGEHIVWDRQKLRDPNLSVGQSVTIREDGTVTQRLSRPGKGLGR